MKDKLNLKNKGLKFYILAPIIFLLITLSISLISAAGVASPYWSTNPLKLAPGETATIQLTLQNMVGDEDINLEATVSGTGVTILDGPVYSVPFGAEVPVNLRVSVPQNANIGESYEISVSFKEVSTGEGGMLRVTSAVTTRFPVEIVGETESSLYGTKTKGEIGIWLWIVLAVLLIGIFFAVKKKKSKSP